MSVHQSVGGRRPGWEVPTPSADHADGQTRHPQTGLTIGPFTDTTTKHLDSEGALR
jgi:hypothetical protein